MTSDRPYRKAQPHAFARRVVTENAGTQFDPAVVSVFLDVIDQWCIEHGIEVEDDAPGIEIVNPIAPERASRIARFDIAAIREADDESDELDAPRAA
jgi:HD-GYP domain-containing protein (c-di-GMP phosphodiesterase class II)